MKKAILILMALVSVAITAQNTPTTQREAKKEFRKNLSPEQRAELIAKKMTLKLNLTDIQQKKVQKVFQEFETNRPEKLGEGKGMTPDQKFETRKTNLDNQIALNRKMKEILEAEQFEKWEKIIREKNSYRKKHHKHSNKKGE